MWFWLFNLGTILKIGLFLFFVMLDIMLFQDSLGLGFLFVFLEVMILLQLRGRGSGLLRGGAGNSRYPQTAFAPQNETQGLDIMLRLMELEAQSRNNANLARTQHGSDSTAERKPVYVSEEHRLMRKIFEVD